MTTAPIHAFEDTWDDAGTLFYGIQLDVTDTASNASSKLIQLDINGSTEFSVQKDGETFIGGTLYATSGGQFVGNFSGDPVFTGNPAFTGSLDFSGVGNVATIRSDLGVAVGSDVQAWSADLDTYAANPLTAAELGELQNIGTTTISAAQWGYLGASTAFGASLMDDADAAAGRTTLGLGTIATQNANSVTITGGSVSGITDLAIADGGTGASNTSDARDNLISDDTGLYFIEDFSPAGDGSTDDSTPITNALTAASGNTLLVSPNTYTVLRPDTGTPISIPSGIYIQGLGADSAFEADVNDGSGTFELFQLGADAHITGMTFEADSAGGTVQFLRPVTGGQVLAFNKFSSNATFSGGSPSYVSHCIDFAGGATIDGFTSFCNDYVNVSRVFLKTNGDTNSQTKLKFIGDRITDPYAEPMAFNNPNGTMQDILAFGISFDNAPQGTNVLGSASGNDVRFAFNCLTGTGEEICHFEEAGRRLVHVGSTVEFSDAVSGTYWGPNDVAGDADFPKYGVEKGNVLGQADTAQTITALSESADTLTIADHGYDEGRRVVYRRTGTTDIGGLENGLPYYVRNPTTDTFQLSETASGAIISLDTTPDDTLPAGTHTIQTFGTGFLFVNSPLSTPACEYVINTDNVAYGWGRGLSLPSRMQNNLFTNNIWDSCDYSVYAVRPTLSVRDNMSVDSRSYDFEVNASGLLGKHSFRRNLAAVYGKDVTGVSESADTLSFSSHEFEDGDRVFYVYRDPDSTGGNAVPGLTSGTAYYVVNSTSTTIQLATEPGGSAIALNASGGTTLPGGDHRVSKWDGIEPFIPNPIKVDNGHIAGFEGWDLEIDRFFLPDMTSGEDWAIMPMGAGMVGRLKVMYSVSDTSYRIRVSDVKWDGSTFTEFVSMDTPVDVTPPSVSANNGTLPTPNGGLVINNAASPLNTELLEFAMELRDVQNDLTTPSEDTMELGAGGVGLVDVRESSGNLCVRLNNTTGNSVQSRLQVIFDGIHVFT